MRGAAEREHSERPAREEPAVPTPSVTRGSALLCSSPRAGDRLGSVSRETPALPRVTWEVTNFSWDAFGKCFVRPGGLRAGWSSRPGLAVLLIDPESISAPNGAGKRNEAI